METGQMVGISARGLCKTFPNGIRAVHEVDLEVRRGEVCALLGPNGAGKTTTVRLLNGNLQPDGGNCTILGQPAGDDAARARSATMSEDVLMYEWLGLGDNLRFYGSLYGMDRRAVDARMEELLPPLGLGDRVKDPVGSLSTGLKKRASLARCLLHRPEVLFLDEPTSGLDPAVAREVVETIRDLAHRDGCAVLLCTHNLSLVEDICDRLVLVSKGCIVARGTRRELAQSINRTPTVRISTLSGKVFEYPCDDPLHINGFLAPLMAAGEALVDVRMVEPDLEAVYLHYLGGTHG